MGCSCCSNEINKDNSLFSNIRKKRISQFLKRVSDNNNTGHLRIDNIGSVNSINLNGVLNITYKNDENTNKRGSTNRIITDLSDNYVSRRLITNNNINNSKSNESILEDIKKTNYNIITIKKKIVKQMKYVKKNIKTRTNAKSISFIYKRKNWLNELL